MYLKLFLYQNFCYIYADPNSARISPEMAMALRAWTQAFAISMLSNLVALSLLLFSQLGSA
jgi:hypothetical protein